MVKTAHLSMLPVTVPVSAVATAITAAKNPVIPPCMGCNTSRQPSAITVLIGNNPQKKYRP